MRRAFLLLSLIFCVMSAHAAPFEIRSASHVLSIEIEKRAPIVELGVRLDSLSSGVLVSEHGAQVVNGALRLSHVVGDLRVRVEIELNATLTARVMVLRGEATVDTFNASWMIERVPGAVLNPQFQVRPSDGGIAPLRVGGDVKPPILLSRVEPQYTVEARNARISGIVIVEVIVDKNGIVRDVRVLKPLPFGLDEKAAEAVRQWKFRPGTLNDQPVEVLHTLTVNFKLSEPPQ